MASVLRLAQRSVGFESSDPTVQLTAEAIMKSFRFGFETYS